MSQLQDDVANASRGRLVPEDLKERFGATERLKDSKARDVEKRFEKIAKEKVLDQTELAKGEAYARGSAKETVSDRKV